MGIRQISVEEASRSMEDPEVVYVDVRTPPEFDRGHPPGALNIPVVLPHPETRQMTPNPDFLDVVAKHVPRSGKLIVGCQMGGRSQLAAEKLSDAGYVDVSNMQGGFGGAKDPMGRVNVPGWIQTGYPVETEAPPGASYVELKGTG